LTGGDATGVRATSMSADLSSRHAAVEIDDRGIALVTIREAKSLNILSTPVIADLTRSVQALAQYDGVRVLILRGTGDKGLTGGADINEMASLTSASAEQFISRLRALCDAVRHFPTPVIARMPGWCLGGGLELVLACDIRIASDDAKLGMPEVKVGIPSVIHAALLPRLIGHARAAWLLLTGEIFDADESLSAGLVSRVVPLTDLDVEVARVADLLAGLGQRVLCQQKRLLREWESEPLEISIENSVAEFAHAFATGEPRKLMVAFMNREG